MSPDTEKLQIGIRLPTATVRRIDVLRGAKPRAEFCRECIERAVADGTSVPHANEETIIAAIESLQDTIAKTYQSAVLTQHDQAKTLSLLEQHHSSAATATAGVLMKIGKLMPTEDERKSARVDAEQFAAHIFYPNNLDQEPYP